MGPTTENVGFYRTKKCIKKKTWQTEKIQTRPPKKNKGTKFKNRGKSRF
jgi:hypothetical protein